MRSHSGSRVVSSVVSQYRCCDCERDFKTNKQLHQHLETAMVHRRGYEAKSEQQAKEPKCKQCKKAFKSKGALHQHLASVRHHPLSKITCLADTKCKKQFNCPSAQLHHLEAGNCVSGMTKQKLDVAIAANDTRRVISSLPAQWLLEDNTSSVNSSTSTSPTRSPIFTPTSTEFQGSYPASPILAPAFTLPSSLGFHKLALRPRITSGPQRCPRCPLTSTRTFMPEALQQHLSSSVHSKLSRGYTKLSLDAGQITYHCPKALTDKGSKQKPNKNFSTVSGLAQHLESGACHGGTGTFRRAVEFVQEEMKALGFVGVKLLR